MKRRIPRTPGARMGIAERWKRFAPLPLDIEQALGELSVFFEETGVLVAYLFGSLAAAGEGQDVDLALLAPGAAHPLWTELADRLGTERLDLVDLRDASPVLRFEVLRTGRLLYAADEAALERFVSETLHLYHDTAALRRRQREWLRRRIALRQTGDPRMVLSREMIEERLRELDGVLHELTKHRDLTRHVLEQNLTLRWAIERGLIAAAELVFDIANHILSARFATYPETYEESLKLLAEKRVISRALYDRLRGFGGFRNVLVHRYRAIDPGAVLENFRKSLQVVPAFAAEVLAWLDAVTEPPRSPA